MGMGRPGNLADVGKPEKASNQKAAFSYWPLALSFVLAAFSLHSPVEELGRGSVSGGLRPLALSH
jgi:hypothetical protein